MRFQYSTLHPAQRTSDALPRIEMELSANGRSTRTLGLVDSGSTINVMPYQVGLDLERALSLSQQGLRAHRGQQHRDVVYRVSSSTCFTQSVTVKKN